MSKTKTPFLSLGSKGTVSGVLTSQKSGGVTILRKTPKPTDPYSLAQAYQRWDYRDYAYLWTLLTNSEKQVYRTRASRYHITGFSLWMREHLKELPDLAGRWRLDEKAGAIAYDSSRNLNHAVIIGATPTDGLIDGAFYFDGLNDSLTSPHSSSLALVGDLSISFFIYPNSFDEYQCIVQKAAAGGAPAPYQIFLEKTGGRLLFYRGNGVVDSIFISSAIPLATWTHVTVTMEGTAVIFYLNGALDLSGPLVTTIADAGQVLKIGRTIINSYPLDAYLDHLSIHNRVLDSTGILRHSERRYP